jgi:hypothetical protein
MDIVDEAQAQWDYVTTTDEYKVFTQALKELRAAEQAKEPEALFEAKTVFEAARKILGNSGAHIAFINLVEMADRITGLDRIE